MKAGKMVSLCDGRQLLFPNRLSGFQVSAGLLVLPVISIRLINLFPAGRFHRFSTGGENFSADIHSQAHLLVLKRWIEDRQEPADNQVVDPPLVDGHVLQAHKLLRGDDGMVVGHLCIVDKRSLRRKGLV